MLDSNDIAQNFIYWVKQIFEQHKDHEPEFQSLMSLGCIDWAEWSFSSSLCHICNECFGLYQGNMMTRDDFISVLNEVKSAEVIMVDDVMKPTKFHFDNLEFETNHL